jgi:hypothetical protein
MVRRSRDSGWPTPDHRRPRHLAQRPEWPRKRGSGTASMPRAPTTRRPALPAPQPSSPNPQPRSRGSEVQPWWRWRRRRMWQQSVGTSVSADLPIRSSASPPITGTTLAVTLRVLGIPVERPLEPNLPQANSVEEVRSTQAPPRAVLRLLEGRSRVCHGGESAACLISASVKCLNRQVRAHPFAQ